MSASACSVSVHHVVRGSSDDDDASFRFGVWPPDSGITAARRRSPVKAMPGGRIFARPRGGGAAFRNAANLPSSDFTVASFDNSFARGHGPGLHLVGMACAYTTLLVGLASATTSNSAGNIARAYIGTLRLNVSDNSYAAADSVLPLTAIERKHVKYDPKRAPPKAVGALNMPKAMAPPGAHWP
mgnify:CR=1 FL=1